MRRYDVVIDGNRTTLLLSDADAAARGLLTAPTPAAAEPVVEHKAKTPANKARKPATKRAEAAKSAFTAKGDAES